MHNVARLITQFIPKHYQLSLALDRPQRSFTGTVTIRGTSPSSTGTMSVHAKDLVIESATVDGKEASFHAGENDEVAIVHPDMKAGEHLVVITFSGKITDGMHGLYPCYFEHDGSKKELLATQFESHHAREVFPCIDEPEAKATFDLTLTTEPNVTVLGNMPIKRQTLQDDQMVTAFETTPRMSTYLLAWVVGELHKKSGKTKNDVEVTIWATPAQAAEKLDFALDHAIKTIEFFDEYFGTPYPLPKSDHVALPDFTAGAMENWGLITYREVALLAHPTTSSISSKQYVAHVVAHELSHQWFGNLVTMRWWEDLWLNESFATLMEYIALEALHPEWDNWLEMSNYRNILALRRDSIDGVQPVRTGVSHPDEISTLFDGAIVYAKGARLLRMLQQYVGPDAFRRGLGDYFAAHAYSNTDADDLWNAIGTASGKDIATFMNTWISQPGYPVVSVGRKDNTVTLEQKRFFTGPHDQSDALWPIPLGSSVLPDLFDTQSTTVSVPNDALIRLNKDDSAHFITSYDQPLLDGLTKEISTLPPLGRLQLLQQQMLLALGREVSVGSLIPLVDAYKDEADQAVWDVVSSVLKELRLYVENDKASETKLKQLSVSVARSQHLRLGWQRQPGEPQADTKLRANVVAAMLYGDDSDAIRAAQGLYESTDPEALEPELRSLILGTAVRHSKDDSVFNALVDRYKTTAAADTKMDIAQALSATKKADQIARLLILVSDTKIVRPQDTVQWFAFIIRSRYGRDPAWRWLRENWAWIKQTFGGDKSLDYFPRIAGNALTTHQHLCEYKEFFEPMRDEPMLSRIIAMAISEIEGRAELIQHETDGVQKALKKL